MVNFSPTALMLITCLCFIYPSSSHIYATSNIAPLPLQALLPLLALSITVSDLSPPPLLYPVNTLQTPPLHYPTLLPMAETLSAIQICHQQFLPTMECTHGHRRRLRMPPPRWSAPALSIWTSAKWLDAGKVSYLIFTC